MTTEHQEELNKITTILFAYVDNIFIIKGIYDSIGNEHIQGIASPYLNFRDALFHFKKMYEAADNGDNNSLLQQVACIDEHLNRGIRDFAINLCSNYFIPAIHKMMLDNAQFVTDEVYQRLRHIYHEIKCIVAEIRISGQELQRFGNNNVNWFTKLINAIQDFNNLLGENPLVQRLYDRIKNEPLQEKKAYLNIKK